MTLSFVLALLALACGGAALLIPEVYRPRAVAVGVVLLAIAEMVEGIKLPG